MKNITSIMLLSSLGAGTVSTMNAQDKTLKVTPDLKGNPFLQRDRKRQRDRKSVV